MLDLRQYRYFAAVAEDLHFGRAARRLSIAQPALSIQIRKLEDQLGGQLFHRTQRSVEMTEAARLLLPQVRELLEHADRVERQARRALSGEIGHLNLGYSSLAVLTGLLKAVVTTLRSEVPDLDIRVSESDPVSMAGAVQSGQLHLGLSTSLGVDIPEGLSCTVCSRWPLKVILPSSHPLAGQQEVEIAELEGEHFIVYRTSVTDDGTQVIRNLGGFHPTNVQEVTSPMMAIPLVAAGFGVSILPDPLARKSTDPGTVAVAIRGEGAQMDCSLIYRKASSEPFVVKAIAMARRALGACQVS